MPHVQDDAEIRDAVRLLRQAVRAKREEGPACKGSIREIHRACGKENCRCASGRSEDFHGPYAQYCFYVGGALKAEVLSEEEEKDVRAAIERYREIETYERAIMILERARLLKHSFSFVRKRWSADAREVVKVLRSLKAPVPTR